MQSRICIIGHGGLTPALREAILMSRQIGLNEIVVLTENNLTQEDLSELANQYDIKATLVESLKDDSGEIKVMVTQEPRSFISELSTLLTEVGQLPVLNKIPYTTCVEFKQAKERCYPKVPPRKLGAGKRR